MKFTVTVKKDFTFVEFESGILTPNDLKAIQPPEVDGSLGLVLSGRGPIWLFCYLSHCYHATKWIGTYDPRIGGAIVTQTHSPVYAVGDIVKIN